MNDLPENELLSAYLDGELTAAERAEVERLLAANPAARQLLDELRTLRAALQALPPQKLGEDLSRQVLREAQRRMLGDAEPGEWATSSAPPEPLGQSFLRRFVNRRTVTWLALTAAIVVMITINERQHRNRLAENVAREVAHAPAARDSLVHAPLPPSSIQAAPADKTLTAGSAAAPARPTVAKEAELPSKRAAAELSLRNIVAEKGRLDEYGPSPAKAGRPARKASGRSAAQKQEDESLLVVHCDISPQAAKSEAFDKLLDANGVVWYLERGQSGGGNDADQKQTPVTGETLVYAETTPAQLKAVLAGLEAQPEVFLAVSVKPARGSRGEAAKQPANQSPAAAPPQAGPLTETKRQLQLQSSRQQVAQSPPRQRVLFVVRVIGRDRPSAAKERK